MRYREMLESPAYRDLRPVARCLLEELQIPFYPDRNGELSISTRRAADRINVSEPTASKAFYELVSHGFIMLKEHAIWQERVARRWRLTFEDTANHPATDDWKFWDPESPFPVPGRKKARPKK